MSKDRGRNLKEYFILSCILENKLSIFKHNKIKKEFHNHIEGNNIIIIGKDEFYCNWVCLYIYIYIYIYKRRQIFQLKGKSEDIQWVSNGGGLSIQVSEMFEL